MNDGPVQWKSIYVLTLEVYTYSGGDRTQNEGGGGGLDNIIRGYDPVDTWRNTSGSKEHHAGGGGFEAQTNPDGKISHVAVNHIIGCSCSVSSCLRHNHINDGSGIKTFT